ncbi:ead/Ea22-like family protein [Klebsiella pneumoniae]|uniref:ead/Ea22-like family protein n=1 Tax=Klebsiella pneumoniae TaxID=573 RepID=UPI002162E395|nr:ead/Ea22-like family protein [Klebsiella pneumoniae]UVN29342.1 ead/Ea22-like family protein [Klebsiella pneumoniae]
MTITLQAVNELIASLESAGELSIREQKFLKLAKAYQQLAAENVALKESRNNLAEFIHEELDADYPLNMNLETHATERIVAGIKADGRVEGAHFVANRMLAAWDAGFIEDTAKNAADIARMILTSTEFMANAPEGDFDRSFADGILEDIAQQLREGAK